MTFPRLPEERAHRALLGTAVLLAALLFAFPMQDFRAYWQATRELAVGGWRGVYRTGELIYKYHPTSLFFFIPMAWLPWVVAKAVWAVINGWTFWDAGRRLAAYWNIRTANVLIALFFVLHGLTWHIKLANVTFVMLWLLVIAATSRRAWVRGASVAVLIIIKPMWLILVPVILLRRDLKGLALTVGALVLLWAVPFLGGLEAGKAAYAWWFEMLADPFYDFEFGKNDNQSVWGALWRHQGMLSIPLVAAYAIASAAMFLPWVAQTGWIRTQRAAALASFTAMPIMLWMWFLGWMHHQLLLLPLFALLWDVRARRPVLVALVLAWILLNGTGELFLGRAAFVWVHQAGFPILAFPLLLWASRELDRSSPAG